MQNKINLSFTAGEKQSISVVMGELAKKIYANAKEKGFWEDSDRIKTVMEYMYDDEDIKFSKSLKRKDDCEKISLIHSELSEAIEALRSGNPRDKHCPEFLNIEIELADAIIRILDFAVYNDLKVIQAIIAKHEYNTTRPRKHGREF